MLSQLRKWLPSVRLSVALATLGVAVLFVSLSGASVVDVLAGGPTPTNSPVPPTNTPSPVPPTPTNSPVPPTPTLTPDPVSVSSTTRSLAGFFGSRNLPAGNFNFNVVFKPALPNDDYNLQTTAIGATCRVTEKTAKGFTVACVGQGTLDWAVLQTRDVGRRGGP